MPERYEIREQIGQGGVGAVYKAFDTQLKREVALKRLIPDKATKTVGNSDAEEVTENLLKEATTLSALQHPNIVTVYDVGKDEKGPFVVMELLRGETFDETIQRGALPLEDFKHVVSQTLEAMIAAQALNVIHRDLKPGNLMVIWLPSGKFQIKILDFGLAKFGKLPSEQTTDQEDGILGSIYFMAPEQFERVKLDARTDMYALGCIYYYALTGKYPFLGEHAPQVMASHLQNRFTPLASLRPDIPEWLANWVEWLISREMSDRPASAKVAFDHFNREESGGRKAATRAIATGAGTVPLRKAAPVSVPQPARAPTRLMATGASKTATAPPSGAGTTRSATGAGKSHFPKWAKVTIPLLIIAGIAILLVKNRKPDVVLDNYDALKEIMESEEPKGDGDTVRLLIEVMEKGGNNGLAANTALRRLTGSGVETAILNSLSNASEQTRIALIGIIVERETEGALVDIAGYLDDKYPTELREAAIYALGELGGESELGDLIPALERTEDEKTRSLLEQAIIEISLSEPDPGKRTVRIRNALAGAAGAYRISLLTILCSLGGDRAWTETQNALNSRDREERLAVLKALGNWPDFTPGAYLLELATGSEDDIERLLAARAVATLLSRPNEVSAEQKVEYVRKLLDLAKQPRERSDLLAVVSQLVDESALATMESFADDPQLGGTAKGVAETMRKSLKDRITIDGEATLSASSARILGDGDIEFDPAEGAIVGWNQPYAALRWAVKFTQPGKYAFSVVQGSDASRNSYTLSTAGQSLDAQVSNTGSESTFETVEIGELDVRNAGSFFVEIMPKKLESYRLMTLREVKARRTGDATPPSEQ